MLETDFKANLKDTKSELEEQCADGLKVVNAEIDQSVYLQESSITVESIINELKNLDAGLKKENNMTEEEAYRQWISLLRSGRISLNEMQVIDDEMVRVSNNPPFWYTEMCEAMDKLIDKHDKAVVLVRQETADGMVIGNYFDVYVPSPYPSYKNSKE